MTGLPIPAIRAMRARFGDLADPIIALRDAGKTVRPYGDQFAVDEVVVDADELVTMAAKLRFRQAAKKHRRTIKRVPGAGDLRAEAAGTAGINDRPGSPSAEHTCDKCGGPRSKWSTSLCRKCYVSSGRASDPKPTARNPFEKSCGDGESRPIGDATSVPSAAPTGTSGAVTRVQVKGEAGLAPGPQDLCGCGHPRSHFGRCWFRRGYAGPNHNPTRRPPRTHTARLTELEARNAALEQALAEIRAHLGMGREQR